MLSFILIPSCIGVFFNVRHTLPKCSNQDGHKRINPAKKGVRPILPGGDTENVQCESGPRAVGDNSAKHRPGILQSTAEILRLKAALPVERAKEPTGHDDGYVLLPGADQDAPRRQDGGDYQPAVAMDAADHPLQNGVRHAGTFKNPGKAQRNEHERHRFHHTQDPAAVDQCVHGIHTGGGGKAIHRHGK